MIPMNQPNSTPRLDPAKTDSGYVRRLEQNKPHRSPEPKCYRGDDHRTPIDFLNWHISSSPSAAKQRHARASKCRDTVAFMHPASKNFPILRWEGTAQCEPFACSQRSSNNSSPADCENTAESQPVSA